MKQLLSLLLFLVFFAVTASAQFEDRTQFQGGLSLEFVPIKYPDGLDFFTVDQLFPGVFVGGEYNLSHTDDFTALAIDAGVKFNFNYSSGYGTQLFLQVPVYLVGKIGAKATKYNDQLFGAAVGIGGAFTHANIPYSIDNAAGFAVFRLKPAWFAPMAMAQLTLNLQGQSYTLRGHVMLSEYSNTENVGGFPAVLNYQNFGVGLIYNF